jgi:hypothetical protein
MLFLTAATVVVDRIALYIIPLQAFVLGRLPFALARQVGGYTQLSLAVIIYSAIVQFVWLNYAVHASSWLPYQWSLP